MTQHLPQVSSREVECVCLCVLHQYVVTGSGIAPGIGGFVVLVETQCDTRSVTVDVKLLQSVTIRFLLQVKSFIFFIEFCSVKMN